MKVGLWSDCHNFPSLPLMKLSAYHKSLGDIVDFVNYFEHYDLVYASKVFSFTEDIEDRAAINADEIRKGGTGYCISVDENGKEVFDETKNTPLPKEIEHIYPDYGLFPKYEYATGFLTRGCPRGCGFCVVGKKEGLCSRQVADLSEFWRGQKEIKFYDGLTDCEIAEVIPETVGQFTGLTDKNGNKIFEGDILQRKINVYRLGEREPSGERMLTGIVVWETHPHCTGSWELSAYDEFGNKANYSFDDSFKVIGNIHDNELLEESNA